MFEIADVIDREGEFGVAKVSYAHLQIFATGVTADELGAHSQATVDGSVGNWGERTIVKLKVVDLSLGDVEYIGRGKYRKIDGFAKSLQEGTFEMACFRTMPTEGS